MLKKNFGDRKFVEDFNIQYSIKDNVFEIDYTNIFNRKTWAILFIDHMRVKIYERNGIIDQWKQNYT